MTKAPKQLSISVTMGLILELLAGAAFNSRGKGRSFCKKNPIKTGGQAAYYKEFSFSK